MRAGALRRCAVTIAVVSMSGCFRYVRSDVDSVPAGEQVRVHLTRAGMVELDELSPASDPVVNGLAMRWESDRLLLRVPVRRRPDLLMEEIGQDVWIPTREIVQLERRQVDAARTGLLTGLGAAAVAGLVIIIVGDAFGGDQSGPPGEDNQMRGFAVHVPLPRGY